MIPRAYVAEWRARAPWAFDEQVEQDLVICRALVAMFSDPIVSSTMALRGGTALHKLYLDPPARYSEDIDLVQVVAGPIGVAQSALMARLDPWLGTPSSKRAQAGITLRYRFNAETEPAVSMRLKVEINTREHFSVLGLKSIPLAVESRWFDASALIRTYEIEELLGTKLRALYQRRKGRDLFDLLRGLERQPQPDPEAIVHCFTQYLRREGRAVSRADFERNLAQKRANPDFLADMRRLSPAKAAEYDPARALDLVQAKLIALIP